MVLNGAYIYNKVFNKSFTRSQLLKFVGYYDNVRIGKYMTVLMSNGYICITGKYKQYAIYNVSDKGMQVIQELNESYEREMYNFCQSNSIEL